MSRVSLNEFGFVHSVTSCGLEIFRMATLCFQKKVVFLLEGWQNPQSSILEARSTEKTIGQQNYTQGKNSISEIIVSCQFVAEVSAHWRESADSHCGITESQEGLS